MQIFVVDARESELRDFAVEIHDELATCALRAALDMRDVQRLQRAARARRLSRSCRSRDVDALHEIAFLDALSANLVAARRELIVAAILDFFLVERTRVDKRRKIEFVALLTQLRS